MGDIGREEEYVEMVPMPEDVPVPEVVPEQPAEPAREAVPAGPVPVLIPAGVVRAGDRIRITATGVLTASGPHERVFDWYG